MGTKEGGYLMGETLVGQLIPEITAWVTAAFGYVTTAVTAVTSNSMLMLFCIAVPLCGLGVGLLRRLISVK